MGIARLYGPEAFGQFTAAHTLSIIFLLLADFGFDILLSSEIARQRERAAELAQNYLSMKVIFALVATLGMALTVYIRDVSESTKVLMYIFSLFVLVSALTNFFFALFKGFEEFQHEMKISFFFNGFLLVTILFLGFLQVPLYIVALVFVASRILGLILSIRVARRLIPIGKLSFRIIDKSYFATVSIFGIHAIFSNLFFIQDTILLSIWRGDYDVGIYQSVFKLISVVFLIPDVIINTLLPVLSRLYETDDNQWAKIGQIMNKTLFLLSLPITIMLFVYAEQIIGFIYGMKAFKESVPILRIFSIVVFFHFSMVTYAIMLTAGRRQKDRMIIVVLATIVNFVLNLFVIPRYGPFGAAGVSLATIIFVGSAYSYAMRPYIFKWTTNIHYLVPFIFSVMMFFILWQVRTITFWYVLPMLIILFGVVIYFVGYTKEERELLFQSRNPSYSID